MIKQYTWKVKARETFVCPICKWRVTEGIETRARTEFRFHMKYTHQVKGKRLKLAP